MNDKSKVPIYSVESSLLSKDACSLGLVLLHVLTDEDSENDQLEHFKQEVRELSYAYTLTFSSVEARVCDDNNKVINRSK